MDESLLDEVRIAVGEACSRAVEGHQRHCPAEPVRLALTDLAGRFEVEVTDTCASGQADKAGPAHPAVTGLPDGLGIAMIAGLADDVKVSETSLGTRITMSWPSAGSGR